MIKFRLEVITPELASYWLSNCNQGNRSIKQAVVKKYAQDITEGQWRITHQCIAFDIAGRLVDGQHRLSAVVLCNRAIQAYIAEYETTEEAMKLPIDMQAKRAVYDVLQVSRRDQETCSALHRLLYPWELASMATLEGMMNNLRDELDSVHGCIKSTVKYRSAAAARAAIVLLIREFPERKVELCGLYSAFVSLDLEGLPSSILALVKNLDCSPIRRGGGVSDQKELFLRVYYAFHPRNRAVRMIRLMNPDAMTKAIRESAAKVGV